jgi:hypothetical protein
MFSSETILNRRNKSFSLLTFTKWHLAITIKIHTMKIEKNRIPKKIPKEIPTGQNCKMLQARFD